MKQITKLKICDWSLLVLTMAILLSGIQLEILHGENPVWIWLHVAIGCAFLGLCAWHVWLHFKRSNWFSRFRKLKSQVTRVLWWVSLLTALTGIVSTVHWLASSEHGAFGAVHGKIGFLMIVLTAAHAIKRRKFYSR